MAEKKQRYFLIDTENVGDRWQEMLEKQKKRDNMIVFYTRNHSRSLEEFIVQHVHDPRFTWLECAAGNNALDYQLIGVLSYLITKQAGSEYHIVSNDKDYEATIAFWKERGIDIWQDGVDMAKPKEAKKEKKAAKKQQKKQEETLKPEPLSEALETIRETETQAEPETKTEPAFCVNPDDAQAVMNFIGALAGAIPISAMQIWHHILVLGLGKEAGGLCYHKIKKDKVMAASLGEKLTGTLPERAGRLIKLLAEQEHLEEEDAQMIYAFLQKYDKKEIRKIREDLLAQFGRERGENCYRILRPALKLIWDLT